MAETNFPGFWPSLWCIDLRPNQRACPKEILLIILSYMGPAEVVALLQCSEASCRELTHRTYEALWEHVFENYQKSAPPQLRLPPCPQDLTLRQYVEMAFSRRCERCGKAPPGISVLFTLRARLCEVCIHKRVVPQEYIIENLLEDGEKFPLHVLPNAPEIDGKTRAGGYYYLPQAKKVISNFRELCHIIPDFHQRNSRNRREWIKSHLDQARSISKTADSLDRWLESWISHSTEERGSPPEIMETSVISEPLSKITAMLKDRSNGWVKEDLPVDARAWKRQLGRKYSMTAEELEDLYLQLIPLVKNRQERRNFERGASDRAKARKDTILKLYMSFKQQLQATASDNQLLLPRGDKIFTVKRLDLLRSTEKADLSCGWQSSLGSLRLVLEIGTMRAIREIDEWYRYTGIAFSCHTITQDLPTLELVDMDSPSSVMGCLDCREPIWSATFHAHKHFVDRYPWDGGSGCLYKRTPEPVTPSSVHGIPRGPGSLIFDGKLREMVAEMVQSSDSCRNYNIKQLLFAGKRYVCSLCDLNHQKPIGFQHLVLHFKNTLHPTSNEGDTQVLPNLFSLLSESEASRQQQRFLNFVATLPKNSEDTSIRVLDDFWTGEMKCNSCTFKGKAGRIGDMLCHVYDRHGLVVVNLTHAP